MVRETVADRPDFHVADMNAWMRSWPGGQFDREVRDGVHFTLGGSQWGARFVVPEVLASVHGTPTPPAPAPPPS
jgi:hypothetical protein